MTAGDESKRITTYVAPRPDAEIAWLRDLALRAGTDQERPDIRITIAEAMRLGAWIERLEADNARFLESLEVAEGAASHWREQSMAFSGALEHALLEVDRVKGINDRMIQRYQAVATPGGES